MREKRFAATVDEIPFFFFGFEMPLHAMMNYI